MVAVGHGERVLDGVDGPQPQGCRRDQSGAAEPADRLRRGRRGTLGEQTGHSFTALSITAISVLWRDTTPRSHALGKYSRSGSAGAVPPFQIRRSVAAQPGTGAWEVTG